MTIGVFLCSMGINAQDTRYDYTDDLYLAIGDIDFGDMCGFDSPNYQPGDTFIYKTHVWIDLYKLYNIAYRRNTFFLGNLTFWTTFGGYGDSSNPGEGWNGGQIDDNEKTFVGTGAFNVGILKFPNVRIPGSTNDKNNQWGTDIYINVFSQCHDACSQGTWWQFQRKLDYQEAVNFANTHRSPSNTDSFVNGENVILTFMGNPSCDPTSRYGFGSNELK